QKDAVLVDPERRPGAVVLLLEDQPADQVEPAPAISLGPGDHAPSALVELALPVAMRFEALSRHVERGQGGLGDVRFHPFAHFLAKAALFGRVFELHAILAETGRGTMRGMVEGG